VLPILEKGEVRSRSLTKSQRGTSGRWHYHCAIELPQHLDAVAFEKLVQKCWSQVHWAHRLTFVRDETDEGWINYMLKPYQKSAFDSRIDCIDLESLHNPIASAQSFFGRIQINPPPRRRSKLGRLVGRYCLNLDNFSRTAIKREVNGHSILRLTLQSQTTLKSISTLGSEWRVK
jgi:hypothetical protein